MYNEVVMDHFRNPRNVGVIENADGVGEVGNPLCGDMMTIYLKITDDQIEDIKFQTFGCGSAIAVSSMLTEIAKGKRIDEAKKITNKDVANALETGVTARTVMWNSIKELNSVKHVNTVSPKSTNSYLRKDPDHGHHQFGSHIFQSASSRSKRSNDRGHSGGLP